MRFVLYISFIKMDEKWWKCDSYSSKWEEWKSQWIYGIVNSSCGTNWTEKVLKRRSVKKQFNALMLLQNKNSQIISDVLWSIFNIWIYSLFFLHFACAPISFTRSLPPFLAYARSLARLVARSLPLSLSLSPSFRLFSAWSLFSTCSIDSMKANSFKEWRKKKKTSAIRNSNIYDK